MSCLRRLILSSIQLILSVLMLKHPIPIAHARIHLRAVGTAFDPFVSAALCDFTASPVGNGPSGSFLASGAIQLFFPLTFFTIVSAIGCLHVLTSLCIKGYTLSVFFGLTRISKMPVPMHTDTLFLLFALDDKVTQELSAQDIPPADVPGRKRKKAIWRTSGISPSLRCRKM